jgi:hypothetical protein
MLLSRWLANSVIIGRTERLKPSGAQVVKEVKEVKEDVQSSIEERKRFMDIANKIAQDGYISITVEENKFLEERRLRSIGREIESACSSQLADPIDY